MHQIMKFSKVNRNSIYIPNPILKKLGLKHNSKVILLCTDSGLQIIRDTMLNQIDTAFEVLGNDIGQLILPEKTQKPEKASESRKGFKAL